MTSPVIFDAFSCLQNKNSEKYYKFSTWLSLEFDSIDFYGILPLYNLNSVSRRVFYCIRCNINVL